MDSTGLGRWSWSTFQGKNQLITRIITAYRPVKATNDHPTTVFAQQEKYFCEHGGYRNPREAFFEDLTNVIQEWLNDGNQIIIGIDANEDTWHGYPQVWATTLGLVNAHRLLYPNLSPVATCNKNASNIPIDGIWISPGVNLADGGMTGFGEIDMDKADH